MRLTIETLGRHNNFNLLRMIAASLVIVSHSYPLSLGSGAAEPLQSFTGLSLGALAVVAFFAMSGLMIAGSFARRKSGLDFAFARILRIVPGLAVVTLLTAFVVGPALSMAPDYLTDWQVWAYSPRAVSLLFWSDHLPGLFHANPYPDAVNGSLWTLYFEVLCYIGLFLAGVSGFLARNRFAWLLALYLVIFLTIKFVSPDNPVSGLSLPFIIGMAAFIHPRLVDWRIATVTSALAFGLSLTGYPVAEIWTVAVALWILWFGRQEHPFLKQYNRLGDYSYGVYVYGFLIQQIIANFLPGVTPVAMMIISLPSAICCGALSWHFIEKPALDLRNRLPDFGRPVIQHG